MKECNTHISTFSNLLMYTRISYIISKRLHLFWNTLSLNFILYILLEIIFKKARLRKESYKENHWVIKGVLYCSFFPILRYSYKYIVLNYLKNYVMISLLPDSQLLYLLSCLIHIFRRKVCDLSSC